MIATQTANTSAAIATAQRVAGASTSVVTRRDSGRPGLSGSNRGRQASATTANVNVNAHAAPMSA